MGEPHPCIRFSDRRQRPCDRRVKRRAYVDLDPGYTQAWLGLPGFSLGQHDLFFTVGERVGLPDCSVPCGGIAWQAIRQPVVLADWPVTAAAAVTVTVQGVVPLQPPPLQPANVEPGSAAAVSWTCVPVLTTSEQTPPQEIEIGRAHV